MSTVIGVKGHQHTYSKSVLLIDLDFMNKMVARQDRNADVVPENLKNPLDCSTMSADMNRTMSQACPYNLGETCFRLILRIASHAAGAAIRAVNYQLFDLDDMVQRPTKIP